MMDLFSQPHKPTGQQLKEQGIKRAIDHADRVSENWGLRASYYLSLYICQPGIETFKTEDVRAFAEAKGLEIPPTKRAWGAVALRAVRDGLISKAGHTTVKNPKAHGAFVALWRVNRDINTL